MASEGAIVRIITRAKCTDELIAGLSKQLKELRTARLEHATQAECTRLRRENDALRRQIDAWKDRLITAQMRNEVSQVLPASVTQGKPEAVPPGPSKVYEQAPVATTPEAGAGDQAKKRVSASKVESKPPPAKKDKAEVKKKADDADDLKPVDISRLDLRVGRILTAQKHPDADSLYVEQVDVGEEKPRTVVSGLVKFVPLEQMQNRMAILMCNLKPAKMRGVLSEAMVMCASTPDKVEILTPPPTAAPGDRVACAQFPGTPDAQLNPKKKVFEQVAPDLKTDNEKRATYKGMPWIVANKEGYILADTLGNAQIK